MNYELARNSETLKSKQNLTPWCGSAPAPGGHALRPRACSHARGPRQHAFGHLIPVERVRVPLEQGGAAAAAAADDPAWYAAAAGLARLVW